MSETIDSFLERNAPKSNDFEVILEHGDILVFTRVADFAALSGLKAQADKFVKSRLEEKSPPEAWADVMVKDRLTLWYVFHMAALHSKRYRYLEEVDPEDEKKTILVPKELPKFEQLDFMKIAKKWPHGFDAIKLAVDAELGVPTITRESQGVLEAKKG